MDVSRTLNEDILLQIFASLNQSSLLSASLVCKRWHNLAQQIIDSTVTLALAQVYEERNLRLFRRITSDEALCKRIKRIVVREVTGIAWRTTRFESTGLGWMVGTSLEPTLARTDSGGRVRESSWKR